MNLNKCTYGMHFKKFIDVWVRVCVRLWLGIYLSIKRKIYILASFRDVNIYGTFFKTSPPFKWDKLKETITIYFCFSYASKVYVLIQRNKFKRIQMSNQSLVWPNFSRAPLLQIVVVAQKNFFFLFIQFVICFMYYLLLC